MLFRQLFDGRTSTFTYVLADEASREAVVIDPVFEQHLRDLALLRELELKPVATLETHVHADHATGAWLLREATGAHIMLGAKSGAEGADRLLSHGDTVPFGRHALTVRATPGHTDGCVSFVCDDETMAFTGDALLIRGAGRTDFQQGDPHALFRSVREQLLSLPPTCRLYPAHDYRGRSVTTVAEERAHNPRLGDHVREEDFVGYMNNLGLPHPKHMAEAVPANLVCGKPRAGESPHSPSWGPAVRTFAGVWEVDPEWAAQAQADLTFVDVREEAEIEASPLGTVAGARVIPLSALRDRVAEVPRDRPVICLCASGARSSIAATILEKGGIVDAANLRGGLLAWHALGLPLGSPLGLPLGAPS